MIRGRAERLATWRGAFASRLLVASACSAYLLLLLISRVEANSQLDGGRNNNGTVRNTTTSAANEALMHAEWAGPNNNIWSLNNRAPLIDCNFDTPNPCVGLVQSLDDDAEWRVRLNRSMLPPVGNLTRQRFIITGYMEAQAGPWIRPGTIVRLRSSRLLPPREGYCLRFTYRFVGNNIGALTVGVLDSLQMRLSNHVYGDQNSGSPDPTTGESAMRRIWFKAGPVNQHWFYANVSFSSRYSFKIIFEALLLGPSNPGSIAIDTISLQTDYCLDFVDADIVVNPNTIDASAGRGNGIFDSPTGGGVGPHANWLPLDSADSLWPGAIIPYEIDTAFSDEDHLTIMGAIEEYHNRTCIKWVPRTNEDSYVSIVNGATGCWSFVGKQGGKQLVNFDTTRPCIQHYVIVHELAHALGLIHEQSRFDRDNFVDVLWPNIQPGFQHNFKKYDREVLSTLRQPYDYDSVMHYPNNAFAKLPSLHTLQAHGQPVRKLGNQDGLSRLDVSKLKTAYQCPNYGHQTTTTRRTTTFRRPPYTTGPLIASTAMPPFRFTPPPTYRPDPVTLATRSPRPNTWLPQRPTRPHRPYYRTTPAPAVTEAPTTEEATSMKPEVDKVENESPIFGQRSASSSPRPSFTSPEISQANDHLRFGTTLAPSTEDQSQTTARPPVQVPTVSGGGSTSSRPPGYSSEEDMATIACGRAGATSPPPAILASAYGYISSPNFNQGFYPPNVNCKWRILAPPDKIIRLTFLTLQLTTSPNCYNDRLVVYDGANDTSANVLGVFCGLFASPPVSSSGNALLVQFNSDPTWEANGFELFYEVVDPDVECIAGRPIPESAVLPATNPTTLCLGMRFTCSGSIVRWEFYSGRDDGGDVYLGVFRLVSSNKYHFVGANMRRAFRKGFNQFYVPIDSQIFVQEGDFIGVFYADPMSGPVISVSEIQSLKRSEVGQTVCLQAYVYKSTIETEMSKAGFIDLEAFASPVVPSFRAIIQGTCGPVPLVRNAYYSSDEPVSSTVGSSVTFTCEAGYHLVGSSVLDCLPTRHWNEVPFCEEESDTFSNAVSDLDCSFHGSLCSWQADTPSWQLSSQEEEFDFTYILTGYLASSFGPDWASTRLVSPEMTLLQYQLPSCFHVFVRMEGFYYQAGNIMNIYTNNANTSVVTQTPDTLVVILMTSKGERPVRIVQPQADPFLSSDWRLINVDINEDGPFKLILEIREGRGRLGSVSLASTKLTTGVCPDDEAPHSNATVPGYERMDGNCPGNLMAQHLHCAICSIEQCAAKCSQQGGDCAGFSYSELQDNRCYLKTTSCDALQASPYIFYKKTET